MTIKARLLIAALLVFIPVGFLAWTSMRVVVEDIVVSWIERYAEKQLRFDKVRTLLPLIQEVKLSQDFAQLVPLKEWAKNPDNLLLKQQAFKATEQFRPYFSDRSYFIALTKNDRYYYSDEQVSRKGEVMTKHDFYRYTLDPNKASDAWFYSLVEKQLDIHLNVNPDVELGVIKLWSDILIRDGEQILGVVGTGLNLKDFLRQMVEKQDIYSAIVFTNYKGAIQLYQQASLIDYASITKQTLDKKQVFHLLDDDDSQQSLKRHYAAAKQDPNQVQMTFVYRHGVRQLASVIYIPEIDWYQVNFIDIDRFLPLEEFLNILIISLISLACSLALFYIMISFVVTRPLKVLDTSIQTLAQHHQVKPCGRFAGAEIKRLVQQYQKMSKALLDQQNKLEQKVATRTAELERLSSCDVLTGLLNRRGFNEQMNLYMTEWEVHNESFGLINIDVNQFKSINDRFGHLAGDEVLQEIASHLSTLVGGMGIVGRWGGDEFLILAKVADGKLESIWHSLQTSKTPLSVVLQGQLEEIQFSFGQSIIQPGESLEKLLLRADKAMYEMKFPTQST
ncbi:GGDEF domain-containing protein [Marinomonas posidonica]|uniref:GGDEF domain-containing protein n=1 Tax=Marinomonas posidonica TaxID=936476 RepID=UPI0037352974